MSKLEKCITSYTKDAIDLDIANSLKYAQKPKESMAFSLSAISKSLYNIMCMMDKEGK